MNEKIVKTDKNESDKIIEYIVKYVKKLNKDKLDKLLSYLNSLITN